MPSTKLFGLMLGAAAIAPAMAQVTAPPPGPEGSAQEVARGYANPPMPNQEAINAGGRAGVQSLNNQVAAQTGAREAANTAAVAAQQRSAEEQAQYQADQNAYWTALAQHDRAVDRHNARVMRQQGAYADAMWAWRRQVAECKRGNTRVCNMPAPQVADFY